MPTSRESALELLARGDAARRAVHARAPWDYRAYFAWAVWLLIAIPPFDFVDGAAWGVVVGVTSAAGSLLTAVYFALGGRDVHLKRAHPMRRWFTFWALWAAWYAAWIVAAATLHDAIPIVFTLTGIAAAIPCFIAGYRSWRAR